MKKILFILLVTSIFYSCNENRIFEKHKALSSNLEWLKSKVVEFDINIEDTTQIYDLSLAFRYAIGYQFGNLLVTVEEVSPLGNTKTYNYSLDVRSENGEYIGDIAGDICDLTQLCEANKKFLEQGKYQYKITHAMPKDKLHLAMEMGLIIDKQEEKSK